MRIAAVQMTAGLGDVEANLKSAGRLAAEAFNSGAEWVILPEFFTTAMGFHPVMLDAARPLDGEPMRLLRDLAVEADGVVGGSFIATRGGDAYNTFVLAFPDGSTYTHDKDQPTMWENCYYLGGNDDGVLRTPEADVGAALCWEFVRSRTPGRLKGKVDMVVGGSCWWTLPERKLPGFTRKLEEKNVEIMADTPARLARMLGVHVVHAAHAGDFECKMPLLPGFPFKSHYLGETQIVDGGGKILARMRREDGEGFIVADIDHKRKWEPCEPVPERFWIPDLPLRFRAVWKYQNAHGKLYYRRVTRPHARKKREG